MKITKTKLKQIIKEELSSLSEADAFSHHADGWDAGGTSQLISTDVEGLPPEGQADPIVDAIVKVEDVGTMIMANYPEEKEALVLIKDLWDRLQGMLTVPSNEVPMSRQ
jgi:hypothetical protein